VCDKGRYHTLKAWEGDFDLSLCELFGVFFSTLFGICPKRKALIGMIALAVSLRSQRPEL
jgi:hypothetical protein